jgi:hypothetical protein
MPIRIAAMARNEAMMPAEEARKPSRSALPPLAGMADQGQQLHRQHRQHAGHEIENEAAEHGQGQDRQQPGNVARGPRFPLRNHRESGGARGRRGGCAVDHGQPEGLAGQLGRGPDSARQDQVQHRHAVALDRLRRQKTEAIRPFDQHIRLLQRRRRAQLHRQNGILAGSSDGDPAHEQSRLIDTPRHPRCEAIDQRRRLRRSGCVYW